MTTTMEQGVDQAELLRRLEREEIAKDRAAATRMKLDFANGLQINFGEMRRLKLRVDDLEDSKRRILHNRQLKAQVDQIDTAEAKLPTLKTEIGNRVRIRDEVVVEHNQQIRQLEIQLDNAHKTIAAGKAARAELIKQCTNPAALAAVEAVDRKIDDCRRESQANHATRSAKWDALAEYKSKIATGSADAATSARAVQLQEDVRLLDERRAVLGEQFEQLKIERERAETQFLCNPDLV